MRLAKRVVETEGMIAIFVALAHVSGPMAPFRTYVTDEGNTIELEARNVARRLISEYITRRKYTDMLKPDRIRYCLRDNTQDI